MLGAILRTQPEQIISSLEDHSSRINKEQIIEAAMNEGLDEFFLALQLCLDKLYTFGVKQVPIKEEVGGQGLSWDNFLELAEALHRRELTGHAARDAIKLAMDVATDKQWNGFYRRILIKDLRCGVSESTVNKVAKKLKLDKYSVPVFECMLAHDGANHEKKIVGKKILQKKLDGVRCLTVVDFESRTVVMYTRNGKVLENFKHVTDYLETQIDNFARSYVIDGEIMSKSFQALMTQVHRKDNVEASDAVLNVFDTLPLSEFKQGISSMGQRRRLNFLKTNFSNIIADSGCMELVDWIEVDLETMVGKIEFQDFNKKMIDEGYEGIMIKDVDAPYECKRSASWLKQKPFIEVSLTVTAVEEGTGKNEGRLGALVCEGTDDGKRIVVNVGSGFTDDQRNEFWDSYQDDPTSMVGQVVEVRADAATRSQDSEEVWSLRFPRFLRFRGFAKGEKL
jgi:DNA ligase-1